MTHRTTGPPNGSENNVFMSRDQVIRALSSKTRAKTEHMYSITKNCWICASTRDVRSESFELGRHLLTLRTHNFRTSKVTTLGVSSCQGYRANCPWRIPRSAVFYVPLWRSAVTVHESRNSVSDLQQQDLIASEVIARMKLSSETTNVW